MMLPATVPRPRALVVAAMLALLAVLPNGRRAQAAPGVLEATWGSSCTPIVANLEFPAAEPLSLTLSVTGNDETHVAYRLQFLLETPQHGVPDAWRFDAAGCQAGLGASVQMEQLPTGAMAKTCPAFDGGTFSSFQIRSYSFNPTFPTTVMRATLINTYPNGNTTMAGQRYFLGRFIFDHTSSVAGPTTPGVSCGGYDAPFVIHFYEPGRLGAMLSAYYRGTFEQSEEVLFLGSVGSVTVNGSLPGEPSTWGKIKRAYRR